MRQDVDGHAARLADHAVRGRAWATFVASEIAGLSGVAEQESGFAAGLVDSSFNIGSALGIAVLSTVAVAHSGEVLAGGGTPAETALAMTEGFQTAFLVALAIAVLGALLAMVLLRRQDETEDRAIEAARTVTPCPPTRASPVPVPDGSAAADEG